MDDYRIDRFISFRGEWNCDYVQRQTNHLHPIQQSFPDIYMHHILNIQRCKKYESHIKAHLTQPKDNTR